LKISFRKLGFFSFSMIRWTRSAAERFFKSRPAAVSFANRSHSMRNSKYYKAQEAARIENLTPIKIVEELDRYIVGQLDAKKAVAIAVRNRWRRSQLETDYQAEVYPSNILMMGPTGSGKTEIARRLSTIYKAPFTKVEVTRFTEVGIVGTDTEDCVNQLVENAIKIEKDARLAHLKETIDTAVRDTLLRDIPGNADDNREKYANGDLDEHEVEIDMPAASSQAPIGNIFGGPGGKLPKGMKGMGINIAQIGDQLGIPSQKKKEKKKMMLGDAKKILEDQELNERIDQEDLKKSAIKRAEEYGIIFLDELDKLADSRDMNSRVSSTKSMKGEGVQKELLSIIEGTIVQTDHGPINTAHILFVASGAFHLSKPTDLLPELQGRLPIRVELVQLSEDDFVKILTQTRANLIEQQVKMMATEGLNIKFTDDAIRAVAKLAWECNTQQENIGARRLRSVIAKVMDELSFKAPLMRGVSQEIDEIYVRKQVADIVHRHAEDLQKFVL